MVYGTFKHYHGDPIREPYSQEAIETLSPEDMDLMAEVYVELADKTASQLRARSHQSGGPWDQTMHTEGHNGVIPLKRIRDWVSEHPVINSKSACDGLQAVMGEDGQLIVPSGWWFGGVPLDYSRQEAYQ